jgi:hypothetical protein
MYKEHGCTALSKETEKSESHATWTPMQQARTARNWTDTDIEERLVEVLGTYIECRERT